MVHRPSLKREFSSWKLARGWSNAALPLCRPSHSKLAMPDDCPTPAGLAVIAG